MSFRAHPRDARISPRSARYPGHLTHAFGSPTFVPVRLQVGFAFLMYIGSSTGTVMGSKTQIGRLLCAGQQGLGAVESGGPGDAFAATSGPLRCCGSAAPLCQA